MNVLRRTVPIAVIGMIAIWVAWLGFGYQPIGDYPNDYAPAMNALLGGHIGAFFAHLPTNGAGGSVLLRAPAALVGKFLLAGQLGIYRAGALFCLLVVAGLAAWIVFDRPLLQVPRLAQAATIGVFLLAPALLDAIRYGHPEEPLGAALCIAAVLLAARDRGVAAGAVLGLAIINKPWGVLAVAPVLLCASRRRLALAASAATVAVVWTGAAELANSAHFARAVFGASHAVVAHPVDLWWPWAHLRAVPGVTPAYFPPAWLSRHARELAVLLSLALAGPLARRSRRSAEDGLALLALAFVVRCALDPSNHVYYQVPLVLALAAWEARTTGWPVLALWATGSFWLVFHTIAGVASLDVQCAAYLIVVGILAVALVPAATGRPWRRATASRKLTPGYHVAS